MGVVGVGAAITTLDMLSILSFNTFTTSSVSTTRTRGHRTVKAMSMDNITSSPVSVHRVLGGGTRRGNTATCRVARTHDNSA